MAFSTTATFSRAAQRRAAGRGARRPPAPGPPPRPPPRSRRSPASQPRWPRIGLDDRPRHQGGAGVIEVDRAPAQPGVSSAPAAERSVEDRGHDSVRGSDQPSDGAALGAEVAGGHLEQALRAGGEEAVAGGGRGARGRRGRGPAPPRGPAGGPSRGRRPSRRRRSAGSAPSPPRRGDAPQSSSSSSKTRGFHARRLDRPAPPRRRSSIMAGVQALGEVGRHPDAELLLLDQGVLEAAGAAAAEEGGRPGAARDGPGGRRPAPAAPAAGARPRPCAAPAAPAPTAERRAARSRGGPPPPAGRRAQGPLDGGEARRRPTSPATTSTALSGR